MNWDFILGVVIGAVFVGCIWYNSSKKAFMGGYAAGYEHAKREDVCLE